MFNFVLQLYKNKDYFLVYMYMFVYVFNLQAHKLGVQVHFVSFGTTYIKAVLYSLHMIPE